MLPTNNQDQAAIGDGMNRFSHLKETDLTYSNQKQNVNSM